MNRVYFIFFFFFSVNFFGSIEAGVFSYESQNQVIKYWEKLNNDFRTTQGTHSFCYKSQNSNVYGQNSETPVRIASVSKSILSLWAIDHYSADYQYETKLFINSDHLHISGGLDPVFSKRKLFFLVNQLNNLGLSHIEKVTFDEKFLVYSNAEEYLGRLLTVTPYRTKRNLFDFLHTPDWFNLEKAYREFIDQSPDWLIDEFQIAPSLDQLNISVGSVEYRPGFDIEKAQFERAYLHLSTYLSQYLKFVNIVSNNFIADQVFKDLGGEKAFDKWISNYIRENLPGRYYLRHTDDEGPLVKLYTGSGLNTQRDGKRVDNFAACSIVLYLMEELESKLGLMNKNLQEIMAVPGVDEGTFSSRLKSPRLKRTLMAKTGTLRHTSALSGVINGLNENLYFGIFHQLSGPKGNARIVQDKMVDYFWSQFSFVDRFEYQSDYFFPSYSTLIPLRP